ncbi:DUF2938 family protein [Salinicola rhizosphaerae]|uniref:DUF2938 family protein n=1 Tax=Salinicola rhizosphaerae TaxID=1443141 RepID=A0ABQ3EDI4_9GAMM|nr:DUF2938 family protein [Salinicola rhizosphaerae]GHB34564.1 hypothetical protein GCM10009038_37120 [Salinicola rhizosphaerae]
MGDVAAFILVVGIGSTIVLDLWAWLVAKTTGMAGTDWGVVGRWLLDIPSGRVVLDSRPDRPAPGGREKTVGWLFHYLVGLAYAMLILLVWGVDYIADPKVVPVFWVGVVISSLAGLLILMPGLGGGILGRKLPNQAAIIAYVIIAHIAFAAGQYVFANLVVSL